MMRTCILLLSLSMLHACAPYQTGKGLNAFDSDTFWCTWDNCSKSSSGGGNDGDSAE